MGIEPTVFTLQKCCFTAKLPRQYIYSTAFDILFKSYYKQIYGSSAVLFPQHEGESIVGITKWSEKDSAWRYVFAIWKQLGLTLRSILFSGLVATAWFFGIWRHRLWFESEDLERLFILTGAASALALLFIGGFAFTKTRDKKDKIVEAILMRDKEAGKELFMRYRDERIDNATLVFLGTTGGIFAAHALVAPWVSAWAGFVAVSVACLIWSKFWVLVTHFDDPIDSSKWIRDRVPQEWMDEDVDAYFDLKGPKNAARKAA